MISSDTMSTTTTHCKNSDTCPGGNCKGCRNMERWCSDPRCHPRCKECEQPRSLTLFGIIVIIVVIVGLIALGVLAYAHFIYPKEALKQGQQQFQ